MAASGRIHVHERDVDDSAAIINADAQILVEHAEDINETEQNAMQDKTRRECRLRINRIIKWWMQTYPDYFENGTRVLSEEDKNDPVKFHYTNDRGIRYTGLNVGYVKALLIINC